MTSSAEVTAADIARIAGVRRSAVSNWRRRHADFPQPIGGPPNSPTFSLAEVESWLSTNRRVEPMSNLEASRPTKPPGQDTALARAIVSLLPPITSGVVLDPASMDGACLAAAIARFGSRVTYVGQTFDAADIDLIRTKLSDAGARKVDVADGEPFDDALAKYLNEADAVVSIPPVMPTFAPEDAFDHRWEFGPPNRGDAPIAWVQAAFAYLKPGATAAVAVPFSAATRASSRRIRAELLRAGVLTHAIGLPERFARSAVPWQIWLLQRPTGRPHYTLRMVDLADQAPQDVPLDEKAWKEVFADTTLTRDIPSIELLDDDVLLVPSAHVAAEFHDVSPDYRDLGGKYGLAVKALPIRVPAFERSETGDLQVVTLSDLARAGALEIRDRRPDVEPGDVLIPYGSGRFDGIIVASEPSDDQRAATVIRCDPDQIDPYFLACFLRSEMNRRQAVGTLGGTFRLDLRRARIPRIPLAEQRRYGDAFRRLIDFSAKAEEVAKVANDAVRTAIHGLTSGVFAPDGKATDGDSAT